MKPIEKTQFKNNPVLLMGVLLVFWGSFAAVGKLTLSAMDNYQLLFWVFAIAAVAMTVLLTVNGKLRKLAELPLREWAKLALFGVPQFLYYFLYMSSLKAIPAVEASILNYLFPVFIVLIAIPVNHEKMTARKAVSLAVCFAGAAVLFTGGSLSNVKMTNLPGDLMAIGAAVSWGLFSNLGKRNSSDEQLSYYIYTLTGLVLSAIPMLAASKPALPSAVALAGCLWISLTNIVLTYVIWFRVLKLADSSLAANLSFFTPFVTLLFIAVFLKEKITAMQLIGLAVILVGNFLQSGFIAKRKVQAAE